MTRILVLCTGNSCRSQMAEGYLKHFGGSRVEVYSAGIEVHGVNPLAIMTMQEDGIDISGQTSNNIEEYKDIRFDHIITVCDHARENCPYFPSKAKRSHRNFRDPAKVQGIEAEVMKAFAEVRDEIKRYCYEFINENP